MFSSLRDKVINFINSQKDFPVIAAIASGLYPLLYYYDRNFSILNSLNQFLFYVFFYLVIPLVVLYVCYEISSRGLSLSKLKSYLLPILNFCFFTFLIIISINGFKSKRMFLFLIIPFILGILLKNHFKKIVVLQYLLAVLVFIKLIPDVYRHFTYSKAWMQQPDNIEEVVFKKRPNIYVIQPDGYANFFELRKDNYNYDNSKFESFLLENNFKLYQNFRSNYYSTLSSNSSMFSMKHHYYNRPPKPGLNEVYKARDFIVGENPVLSIFKKNNYKTFLLLEKSYLLLNRPEVGYDYSNLLPDEISYFSRSHEILKDINQDLEAAISNNRTTNNFFFIEKLKPGHISTRSGDSRGIDKERENYHIELEESNVWLEEAIGIINKNDPNGLVVIVADHGGFVGMDYTLRCQEKQTERDMVYTIFTAALAIKWPDRAPDFDYKLKSNVNLFRILFSYLSNNEAYLGNLQQDDSYTVIEKGAPFGVYKLIDNEGNVVFDKEE